MFCSSDGILRNSVLLACLEPSVLPRVIVGENDSIFVFATGGAVYKLISRSLRSPTRVPKTFVLLLRSVCPQLSCELQLQSCFSGAVMHVAMVFVGVHNEDEEALRLVVSVRFETHEKT